MNKKLIKSILLIICIILSCVYCEILTSKTNINIEEKSNNEFTVNNLIEDNFLGGIPSTSSYSPIQTYNFGSYRTDASRNSSSFIACSAYSCSLYEKTSTSPVQTYSTTGVISGYSISGDGNYIALGDISNKRIYFHNKSDSSPIWTYDAGGEILALDLSYNGSYLAATANDGNVYFFNKTGPTPMWTKSIGGLPRGLAITPDGYYFAVGSTNGNAYLFNKTDSTPMRTYNIDGEGEFMDISDDGKYIVIGIKKIPLTEKCDVYLFNSTDDTKMWNYNMNGFVASTAISSNGDYLVAGGFDYKVHFFNKSTPTPLWSYTTEDLVSSVDISSDGKTIVAGSWDYNGYVFNSSGSLLFKFIESNYVDYAAMSEDGKYILFVVSGQNTYIYYWSPPHSFLLTTDADNPDRNGMFNLTWTESIGADNYSVYHDDSYINYPDSAELVQEGIEKLNYSTSNLEGGHYYIVVAYNESGMRISNNVFITINIPNYIIHINANWTLTNSTYKWCSGKGTKEKPFFIQNITVNGFREAICIFIENTEDHFIIKNCKIINGRFGIKLENVTNFHIFNNSILGINATDGIDGLDYQLNNDGSIGNDAIGVIINNCHNFNLTLNNISNLKGGNGGKGGIGIDGINPGGNGGNGGSAIGILVNNSSYFSTLNNHFKNIRGGNGGSGGHGYEGYSGMFNGFGSDGGNGGIGGFAICINIENSNNSYHFQNTIINTYGGKGGDGGEGGDGQPNPGWFFIESFGGHGGNGGKGGDAIAINHQNSINITNTLNIIKNFTAGNGGNAGVGGIGRGGALGPGGNGGDGGEGGWIFGFSFIDSYIITNNNNNFSYFNSGNGGEGGNGGKGSNGVVNFASGDAEKGGDGGSGGDGGGLTELYFQNVLNVKNYHNNFNNFTCGSGNNAGNGGDGGNGVQIGDGGDAGNGANGGDSGSLYGICLINTNNTRNYNNKLINFIGGFGGNGSNGGNGGNGISGGDGGSAGNGGSGGDSGTIVGIFSENSRNITNYQNNLFYFNGNIGGNGGDGGNGGNGAPIGLAGNGGDGGNGNLISGFFITNTVLANCSNNNLSYIFDSYGGFGGSVGTGSGAPISGINGINYQGTGIILTLNCYDNEFSNNNISYNSIGIYIEDNCDNNNFTENRIHNNKNYGILILNTSGVCENNLFFLNNFSNPLGINAYDNGTNNLWNNTEIGNWWHDYGGVDIYDDGIGDTPYDIPGAAEVKDNYPIWDDGPETVKPDIIFINPNKNNTKITQSPYNIIVDILDHHPPTTGNVCVFIYNSTYDLMFNHTMTFNGGTQWIFTWSNVSLYDDGLIYIIKIRAVDSSLNQNVNWSVSMYITIKIRPYIYDIDDSNDDDDGDEEEFDLIEFLLSPLGLTIIGGASAAGITIIFLKKKITKKSIMKE